MPVATFWAVCGPSRSPLGRHWAVRRRPMWPSDDQQRPALSQVNGQVIRLTWSAMDELVCTPGIVPDTACVRLAPRTTTVALGRLSGDRAADQHAGNHA